MNCGLIQPTTQQLNKVLYWYYIGLKLVKGKLDTLYEKDATQLAFLAFDKFVKFRRPDSMDIPEFLRKFELMKNKCETYRFVIPENILAYFMLSCANLPKDKEDIIRATIEDLKVSHMNHMNMNMVIKVVNPNWATG